MQCGTIFAHLYSPSVVALASLCCDNFGEQLEKVHRSGTISDRSGIPLVRVILALVADRITMVNCLHISFATFNASQCIGHDQYCNRILDVKDVIFIFCSNSACNQSSVCLRVLSRSVRWRLIIIR